MDSIFHEKQEGFLCAQHCLNALLQNNYFNAVDLATLANQLDEEERIALSRGGLESRDYLDYIANGSQNMDDSGFFSIQVICKALEVWGLELVTLQREDISSPLNLTEKNAFICNFRQHWLTIRRIGYQWFNLNSLLSGPELLSESYLCLYLSQLIQEGYSIFAVIGELPLCPADDILRRDPVVPHSYHSRVPARMNVDEDDWELKEAIAASLTQVESVDPTLQHVLSKSAEEDINYGITSAINENLESNQESIPSKEDPPSREDIRARRQKFLDNLSKTSE